MNILDALDAASLRGDVPDFRPGDTVKVDVLVKEGNRERVQAFQGVVIRRHGGGLQETFTVRKVSFGVGVERTFPVHTPVIQSIQVVTRGDVRRAKLYYLRGRVGKRARVRERRYTRAEEVVEPGLLHPPEADEPQVPAAPAVPPAPEADAAEGGAAASEPTPADAASA